MKVAILLDDDIVRPDGVQQYVRTMAAFLHQAGHEVHIWCSGDGPAADIPGVAQVHYLVRNWQVSFNGNGLRTPRLVSRRRVAAKLRAEAYDVLHIQLPHSPLFAARVVNAAKRVSPQTRVVGTFHILPHTPFAAVATRLLGTLLHRNLSKFDACCAVSPPAVTFAARSFRISATWIPNAVDVEQFRAQAAAQPWERSDRLQLVFMGRLVERKGAAELLSALALLPNEVRSQLQVTIAGKGPLAADLQAQSSRAGLTDVVDFVGFVSESAKPGLLAAADLAVFPATGGESFGIVLLEAAAAGAQVVIGGDNPGYRAVLQDDEALIDATDPQAFATRLSELLRDAELRQRLHRRQQAWISQFDVARVGAQLLDLYQGR